MEQKVKEIMTKVFNVDISAIKDNASPDTIERWDSLHHMVLVVALEEEFGVEIRDEQINEMLNYRLILIILKELLHGKSENLK